MMAFTQCRSCDKWLSVKTYPPVPFNETVWQVACPHCGLVTTVDIEDYLIPVDTKVQWGNRVAYTVKAEPDGCRSFSDIRYVIRLADTDEVVTVPFGELKLVEDSRRLRKEGGRIARVCHYPRNEERSNVPCYNCVDRAKCDHDIYNALWLYEASGLSPEDVNEVARILKQHDLTVKDISAVLSNYQFGRQKEVS